MTLAFSQLPQPSSCFRRWDPRWKLAAFVPTVLTVLLLASLTGAAVALFFALSLALAARLPWQWTSVRVFGVLVLLSPFLLTMPFLVADPRAPNVQTLFHYSWFGARLALLITCKALSVVLLGMVLLTSAPLETTLKAARSLRVPGVLVQVTLLTYRFLSLIMEELRRLRIAVRIRGYRNRASLHCYRTVGQVMGTLLVRSQMRAERVGHAMRCRGFDGRFRALSDLRTTWNDAAAFLAASALSAGLIVLDRMVFA